MSNQALNENEKAYIESWIYDIESVDMARRTDESGNEVYKLMLRRGKLRGFQITMFCHAKTVLAMPHWADVSADPEYEGVSIFWCDKLKYEATGTNRATKLVVNTTSGIAYQFYVVPAEGKDPFKEKSDGAES